MRSPFIQIEVNTPVPTAPTGTLKLEKSIIVAHYKTVSLDYRNDSFGPDKCTCYLHYGDNKFRYIDKASFDRVSEQLLKMKEENRIVLEFDTKDLKGAVTHHQIPCDPYDVSFQNDQELTKCEILIKHDLHSSTGWITFTNADEYLRIRDQVEKARSDA